MNSPILAVRPQRLAFGVVVIVLAVALIFVVTSARASHVPDYPFPCEVGLDCIQEVSREVDEEGEFLSHYFGVITPGKPLIMAAPPNATKPQAVVDRIMVAACDISSGIGSEGTWECDFTQDFFLELGMVRRPNVYGCAHVVYVRCMQCGPLGTSHVYLERPDLPATTGVGHFAQLFWVPDSLNPNEGKWHAKWNNVTFFDVEGPKSNAVFAGSRTTHARNDLGVTWFTGLTFATSDGVHETFHAWNGPFRWSEHDRPRFSSKQIGLSEHNVVTSWHLGESTPTPVATEDIGCNH